MSVAIPQQNPIFSPAGKQFAHLFSDSPLVLDSGATLAHITVAYETYGSLSPSADNCILVCHALTGDSHPLRHSGDGRPGWWEQAVGPARAIDTRQYFVVCANVLGGCQGTTGPSSTNPATGRPWGTAFPVITTRDMVRVQRALLDHLGVRRLHAVVGGSLGGMQAMQWAVTYPDDVRGIVPLGSSGRFHPQGIAYNEVQRQAVMSDANWRGGHYYDGPGPDQGLRIARMLGMITYRSDESMWAQFGREVRGAGADLDRGFGVAYQVESYLHHNGDTLLRRFDANSYLYLSRAMDLHDIGRGFPDYASAYGRIKAKALVVGIRSDILFPPYLSIEIVEMMREAGRKAQYLEMDSKWGHDAFLVDFAAVSETIRAFLRGL